VESRKTKKYRTDTLRSICKQLGIRGVSPEEEKEGYGGKDLQKRKVLTYGVQSVHTVSAVESTASSVSVICPCTVTAPQPAMHFDIVWLVT